MKSFDQERATLFATTNKFGQLASVSTSFLVLANVDATVQCASESLKIVPDRFDVTSISTPLKVSAELPPSMFAKLMANGSTESVVCELIVLEAGLALGYKVICMRLCIFHS